MQTSQQNSTDRTRTLQVQQDQSRTYLCVTCGFSCWLWRSKDPSVPLRSGCGDFSQRLFDVFSRFSERDYPCVVFFSAGSSCFFRSRISLCVCRALSHCSDEQFLGHTPIVRCPHRATGPVDSGAGSAGRNLDSILQYTVGGRGSLGPRFVRLLQTGLPFQNLYATLKYFSERNSMIQQQRECD